MPADGHSGERRDEPGGLPPGVSNPGEAIASGCMKAALVAGAILLLLVVAAFGIFVGTCCR